MATCNELYKMEPVSTGTVEDLRGFYYDHIPEVRNNMRDNVTTDRVVVKYIKNHCFDGRRIWRLGTVWFDGEPVMVIQNAGWEGDEHRCRFITDESRFIEMCKHIHNLWDEGLNLDHLCTIHTPEEDFGDKLTTFYGYSLGGQFEKML